MSTYLYLECLDHDPPLRSDGEVGQHLRDLPDIRRDIANRAAIVAAGEADLWPDYGHHFRHNAELFLCRHPKCRIGIRDEYGDVHPVENVDG